MDITAPSRLDPEGHQRGADKLARIPVKIAPQEKVAKKPAWIRARVPSDPRVAEIKRLMRELKLSSVCEEASCPNLGECFSHGTATFMIMGDICTRRCPFCDVAHGRPKPLDPDEPEKPRQGDRAARARVHRHHLRRSGRPARRWLGSLRGMHPGGAGALPRHPHRGAGARLPGPHGPRARRDGRRPAGRLQPQPRDRAASLPPVPPRFGLRVVARSSREAQAALPPTCRPSPA